MVALTDRDVLKAPHASKRVLREITNALDGLGLQLREAKHV